MELDHTVYPPQAFIPTKRGERAGKGQCLSCRTKWTAVGPCPVCAVGWPDQIAERIKADQPPTAPPATRAKPSRSGS